MRCSRAGRRLGGPGRAGLAGFIVLIAAVVWLWLIPLASAGAALPAADDPSARRPGGVSVARALPFSSAQSYVLPYKAWNGKRREAVLLLPQDYSPAGTDKLPCIIVTHPRGSTPYATAGMWDELPTQYHFAVLCAGSAGRREPTDSWAFAGQIKDLIELPDVVAATMPWVRLDRDRLYAAGVSMGGTEALALLARYPDRLAAVASFDGVADVAAYYYRVPISRRTAYQSVLRHEVGGSPHTAAFGYAIRSPLTFAATLASARVPIGVWWSRRDRSVPQQETAQSGRLCAAIRSHSAAALLTEVVTSYIHGYVLQSDPTRLLSFLRPGGRWRTRRASAPAQWSYSSWLPNVTVWDYHFTTRSHLRRLWSVTVSKGAVAVKAPAPLNVQLPYADHGRPATVVLNGESTLVWPQGGVLPLQFPSGSSTAFIDP